MFKLAVFDLDGTLFDTLPDIHNSVAYIFAMNNLNAPSIGQSRVFMGDGLKSFMAKVSALYNAPDISRLTDNFIEYYSNNCTILTKPYEGVTELLDALSDKGVTLAVLSNKNVALVNAILEKFGMARYFSLISGGDSFSAKKPSPIPLIETARLLGFGSDLSQVIMIGDSGNDIGAANSAGIKTLYCSYGYGDTIKGEIDFKADKPLDILNLWQVNR